MQPWQTEHMRFPQVCVADKSQANYNEFTLDRTTRRTAASIIHVLPPQNNLGGPAA
jgi:hypothetical protein